MTDFLDAWERGDVRLIGRRSDGAVEAVPGYLRHSLFLALHPRTGVLLPAVWRGQPPPDVLRHSYSDLKVPRMELPSAEAPAVPDPSEAPLAAETLWLAQQISPLSQYRLSWSRTLPQRSTIRRHHRMRQYPRRTHRRLKQEHLHLPCPRQPARRRSARRYWWQRPYARRYRG